MRRTGKIPAGRDYVPAGKHRRTEIVSEAVLVSHIVIAAVKSKRR